MSKSNKPFLIRSLVHYSADHDQSIPARGLNLRFGQVVAVIDANDNNWWRACPIEVRVNDENMEINMLRDQSGLIPSQRRFKRKLLKKMIRKVKWNEDDLEEKVTFAPFPHEYLEESEYNERMKQKEKKKRNKELDDNLYTTSNKFGSYKNMASENQSRLLNSAIAYQSLEKPLLSSRNVDNQDSIDSKNSSNSNTNNNNEMNNARSNSSINTLYNSGIGLGIDSKILENKKAYEYVEAGYTQLTPRPVMILGLLRDKLHSDLIFRDPEKFAFVVPHTTRPQRPNEINGQDYHFITKEEMQQRIDQKEFIEAGVYKVNLYGTSVQAVRDIANDNKYALLDVSGGAIHNLISHDIDPIVILIKLQQSNWLLDAKFASSEHEAEKLFAKEKTTEEIFLEHCTSLIPVSDIDTLDDITQQVLEVVQNETAIVWKKVKDPTC